MDPQSLLLAATGQAAAAALASGSPSLNSSKGFKHLLDTQSLVDCTLACNGGKISAHKIVLSACSNYLARILMEHPTEHPIIILPELNIDDVKTLVHYMYTGELLKSSDKMNSTSLLRTAAILSINSLNDIFTSAAAAQQQLLRVAAFGLANENANCSQFNTVESLINSLQQQQSQLATNLQLADLCAALSGAVAEQQSGGERTDSLLASSAFGSNSMSTTFPQLVTIATDEPQTNEAQSAISRASKFGAPSGKATNEQQTSSGGRKQQTRASASTQQSGGHSNGEFQFKCQICHNDFQTICSFEYHMQRAHGVKSFCCKICHKPFASLRYVLTDHMRRCHGWRPPSSSSSSQSTGNPSSPGDATGTPSQSSKSLV